MILVAIFSMLAIRPRLISVKLGTASFTATVADTPVARSQGLSNTAMLPQNQAMLFVFPSDATWQFWMKDMRYSLDMVWLDASKKVITIAPNATPASYPQTIFSPSAPARYVLEINAGVAAKANITVGEKATFTVP